MKARGFLKGHKTAKADELSTVVFKDGGEVLASKLTKMQGSSWVVKWILKELVRIRRCT